MVIDLRAIDRLHVDKTWLYSSMCVCVIEANPREDFLYSWIASLVNTLAYSIVSHPKRHKTENFPKKLAIVPWAYTSNLVGYLNHFEPTSFKEKFVERS